MYTKARESHLDGLAIHDSSEQFALLDGFLSVTVQVEGTFALHADWEQVGLFVGLHKALLVLLFRNIADGHFEGLADSGFESDVLSARVQVHLVD